MRPLPMLINTPLLYLTLPHAPDAASIAMLTKEQKSHSKQMQLAFRHPYPHNRAEPDIKPITTNRMMPRHCVGNTKFREKCKTFEKVYSTE